MNGCDYDFVIVGSGFGGSVAGLRLVEKGYRVLMLEQGREIRVEDMPKTNWDLRRWMWLPWLRFRGFFRMSFFRHITIVSGVAVGGGSITYGCTLPTPGKEFFKTGDWAGLCDWQQELKPYYQTVRRMLGVARNTVLGQADYALQDLARARGRLDLFEPTEVGIYLGPDGKTVQDPYFDGHGPDRTGCRHCGGCMLGCRFNAKNTLDKNYLHLARAQGLELRSETKAVHLSPRAPGGYQLAIKGPSGLAHVTARQVVLAGGVLGTLDLLLKMKARPDGMPNTSPLLGCRIRTNSESFIGVISRKPHIDLSQGLAIGSIYHCAPGESVEPVRYSDHSGFLRVMIAPHVEGHNSLQRLARLAWIFARHPYQVFRGFTAWNLARKMTILMYMRTCEGTLRFSRSWRGLRTHREAGPAPSAHIPEASELARQSAQNLKGIPFSVVQETLFNIPTTAHVLGGVTMGANPQTGVIDSKHRLFGYPGVYVVDGSALSSNPGVNPSLSIAALAERAMAHIAPKS